MRSKIIIAEVVELIFLLIVFSIFFHFFPLTTPIIIAIDVDNNRAI
tara:strand:+ start:4370 stop:4507 length:138 start_codon:yes stop_codon:yes gene_type:complete